MCSKSSRKASPTVKAPHGSSLVRLHAGSADGTLYTGIATDVQRRLTEHNEGRAAARYTRARRPVRVVHVEGVSSRAEAARREAAIKRLSRDEKLSLIVAPLEPA